MPATTFGLATCSSAGGVPGGPMSARFAAIVVNERVLSLASAVSYLRRHGLELSAVGSVLELLTHWEHNFVVLQRLAEACVNDRDPELERAAAPLTAVHLHPPVDLPRQVFCSGANYKKHVIELHVAQTFHKNEGMSREERLAAGTKMMDERAATGTPFFFCKAQSTVTGPYDAIVLPADVTQPDWELELGVVIGKPARHVRRAEALDYVAGYVVVNDITARERVNRKDMKEMGMDWVASKCAPTFLPMGPWLAPAAFVGDPQQLRINLKLNGQTMQDESTADMIFDVARLIETLSAFCLLQPGDLLCTGSPAGNGMHHGRFLRPGDVVEGTIDGVGTIRNTCVAA